jgi:glutathione reductase (NADPH)
MEAFNALAIDVRTKTVVEAIDKTDSGFVVHARSDRKSETFEADFVVHAAGRTPALEELDLAAADIQVEKGRLKLNDFCKVYQIPPSTQPEIPLRWVPL